MNGALHEWGIEDLRRSGIPLESGLEAGFCGVDRNQVYELLGFCPPDMPEAYEIPFLDPATGAAMLTPDGKPFTRLKLRSSIRMGDGEAKYLSPRAGGTHVYIPLAAHQAVLAGAPLVITEGEKKALSATLAGIPTFGLTGVFGGIDAVSRDIHPDLEPYLKDGREVTFVLDSDAACNASIALAAYRFNKVASVRGCRVKVVVLPAHFEGGAVMKAGMDDILVRDGVGRLREILAGAEDLTGEVSSIYLKWLKRFCAACKSAGVDLEWLATEIVRKGLYDRVNSETRRKVYDHLGKTWSELAEAVKTAIRSKMTVEFAGITPPEHGGEGITATSRIRLPGFDEVGQVDSIDGDIIFCFTPESRYSSRPFFIIHLVDMTIPKPSTGLPVVSEGGNEKDPATIRMQAAFFTVVTDKRLSATEKNKQIAAIVLEELHQRGRFFFHSENKDFASSMFFDARRKVLLGLNSDQFKSWLSRWTGLSMSETSFEYVVNGVEVESLQGLTMGIIPNSYWAQTEKGIYLSCGDGEMARITAAGIDNVDNGTDGILFASGFTLPPWTFTEPLDPFEACRLFRDAATTTTAGKDLLKLWILSLPTNQAWRPALVATGAPGSGKTRVITGVFEMFGIPQRIVGICDMGEADFWTQVNAGGLLCLDNVDSRIKWLPDALAAAATNGSHEKRMLYTDNTIVRQHANSWVAITSADPMFAADPGLGDRLLVCRFDRRIAETAERALSEEIAANRDGCLSWVAVCLQKALADSVPVPAGLNRRHPDFASFAVRLGRALGMEERAIKALKAAESDKSRFNIENDDIGAMLLTIGKFDGTVADLKLVLTKMDPAFAWSPQKLARRILKLWPHLEVTLGAKQETGHGGGLVYHFTHLNGDSGDSKRLFSENSREKELVNGNLKTRIESHHSHQMASLECVVPPIAGAQLIGNETPGNALQWGAERVA